MTKLADWLYVKGNTPTGLHNMPLGAALTNATKMAICNRILVA